MLLQFLDWLLISYHVKQSNCKSTLKLKFELEGVSKIMMAEIITLAMENTFLKCISEFVQKAGYVLAICAGFALLAKAGALDGFKATSNKKALEWVMSVSNQVDWIRLEYKSVGSFGGYLNE